METNHEASNEERELCIIATHRISFFFYKLFEIYVHIFFAAFFEAKNFWRTCFALC